MKRFFREVRLFFRITQANIKGMVSFKIDFLITFISGLLLQTIGLVFLFVLFQNIPAVAGWNLYEVALLYSHIFFAEGILTFLFQGTTGLNYFVRIGDFDKFMLRPFSITTQVCSATTNFAGIGTALTGLALMTFSLKEISLRPSAIQLLILVLSLIMGVIIRVNINYGSNAAVFWLEGGGGLNPFIYNLQEMAKYPLGLYPKVISILFLTLLPYGVISYIPVAVLLGKLSIAYIGIVPVSTVFIIYFRKFIMSRALLRYDSVGN